MTETDETARAKKMPVSRVDEPGVGAAGQHQHQQERRHEHDERCGGEDELVGLGREDVFLLDPLADLGQQLERAVGAGLHRAEPALHERHHLEQVEVDDGAGGSSTGKHQADDRLEARSPASRPARRTRSASQVQARRSHGAHRSMSPRMKYSDGQDRDDVGHVDTLEHPRRDRHVVEAGRADLDPERGEVTLGHDVVAHLAERVLGGDVGLALGHLDDARHLGHDRPEGMPSSSCSTMLQASRTSWRRTQKRAERVAVGVGPDLPVDLVP